ncbi:hypothetical protein KSP39_PZI014079 [Platanthera zijinensis]|uniref:Uncharacterized protein n=1 Tax=Platanthera zijinensis TaxID=2320716 RepID=A0AAP0BBR8_9ASPA
MKTGGIVVCSTFVALVYIPEYPYGRSITQNLWVTVWRMPPGGTAESVLIAVQSENMSHFSESMVLAPLSPTAPWGSLVHSFGDPLLSRLSFCSSFRPVSSIYAH